MIYNAYALYDTVSESYMLPSYARNDDQTIRDLVVGITHNRESLLYFKPEDFLLYHVGTYDNEKGIISGSLPRLVGRVGEFLKSEVNDNE